MSNMIVLAFDREDGAEQMREKMLDMQNRYIVNLTDAAVLVRKQDGKVKVKQARSLVGAGALGGSFWGLLIGLIFLAPIAGMAIGALVGALAGKSTNIGLDDKFMKQVGDTIKPGMSALFLLVSGATPDRMLEELQGCDCQVLQTSLSKEDEQRLKDALAAEEVKA